MPGETVFHGMLAAQACDEAARSGKIDASTAESGDHATPALSVFGEQCRIAYGFICEGTNPLELIFSFDLACSPGRALPRVAKLVVPQSRMGSGVILFGPGRALIRAVERAARWDDSTFIRHHLLL